MVKWLLADVVEKSKRLSRWQVGLKPIYFIGVWRIKKSFPGNVVVVLVLFILLLSNYYILLFD